MNRSRWIYLTIFVLAAPGLSGYVSSGPAMNPGARHAAAQDEIVVAEATCAGDAEWLWHA